MSYDSIRLCAVELLQALEPTLLQAAAAPPAAAPSAPSAAPSAAAAAAGGPYQSLSELLSALQPPSGNGPCTAVWTSGTIAYRCKTCAVSSSSAVSALGNDTHGSLQHTDPPPVISPLAALLCKRQALSYTAAPRVHLAAARWWVLYPGLWTTTNNSFLPPPPRLQTTSSPPSPPLCPRCPCVVHVCVSFQGWWSGYAHLYYVRFVSRPLWGLHTAEPLVASADIVAHPTHSAFVSHRSVSLASKLVGMKRLCHKGLVRAAKVLSDPCCC